MVNRCLIVDKNAPAEFFDFLKRNDIEYIKSLEIPNVISAVSTHPDMQICKVGKNSFVCEPTTYQYYKKHLEIYGANIAMGETFVKSNYPDDVAYNVVITENYMLHNTKHTDSAILNYANNNGLSIYTTAQGYTKCATCVMGNNTIITADNGILRICVSNGIDCLLIEEDDIILGNRNDGFIGGTSGLLDDKTMLFCGDITKHKSYKQILEFARSHDVEILCSHKGPLTDIGSIISVI